MPVIPAFPGVFVQEVDSGAHVIAGVPTSITAFVGRAVKGALNEPITVSNYAEFESAFGGFAAGMPVPYAVHDFFENGGTQAVVVCVSAGGDALTTDMMIGREKDRTGIYALEKADLFNIMVIPPDPTLGGDLGMTVIYRAAAKYCAGRRAILIADPLDAWSAMATARTFDRIQPSDYGIDDIADRRSVFAYFPRITKADPLRENREHVFSAAGMIAGVFAGTDGRRGVWKAPAGIEAALNGVIALESGLTDAQNGQLNQAGINVLRDFPQVGKVVWGARTLAGADSLSDDYKYVAVRRLTNFLEESLSRSMKFAVFEPNAEPLWAEVRLRIGAFMSDLARKGAFYDYYVRCDASTTTQHDVDSGRVNVLVAFAPVRPAEFVILTIQQLAMKPAT